MENNSTTNQLDTTGPRDWAMRRLIQREAELLTTQKEIVGILRDLSKAAATAQDLADRVGVVPSALNPIHDLAHELACRTRSVEALDAEITELRQGLDLI